MEEDSSEAVTCSSSVLTTTASGTSAPNVQSTPTNHTDPQTVQVVQQAVQRPAGVAQYLQQMYAAQQHHMMLQALHQHQQTSSSPALSTASAQQVSQANSWQAMPPPPSANGSTAQTAITLPSSPVTQLQSSSVSGSTGAISQQAVLLGNGSTRGSQAQMFLRTQMLILAPAACVAADLPSLSSASSQPSSTQVPSLALRTQLPGALSAARGVQLKACHGQTLVTPLPRMSICPLKSTQLTQTLAETSRTLSPSQKGASSQLILQTTVAQRQVQPIALRVTAQDAGCSPLPLLTRPTSATVLSQHCEASGPAPSDKPANDAGVASTSTLPSASSFLPDPPPLHLGPVVDPISQAQTLGCPPPLPPLTLALARLPLSLRSIPAVAVQSDHKQDKLPVTEALLQLPFHNFPPPQTTAVDLKVQPNRNMDPPAGKGASQQVEQEGAQDDVVREVEQKNHDQSRSRSRTPTPPALSPTEEPQNPSGDGTLSGLCARANTANTVNAANTAVSGSLESSCLQSSSTMVGSAEVAASASPPPSLQPVVRSSSSSPQANVRPHILTHLIEGFIITEGMEPFSVAATSQEKPWQTRLPVDGDQLENGELEHHSPLLDMEQSENSDSDIDMDNALIEDEIRGVRPSALPQCEFCGKKGYTHTLLRSKRFCSMTCIRSFNVSLTTRLAVLNAHRMTCWPKRPLGRRGRPPSRINRTHQEHLYREGSYRAALTQQAPVSSLRADEAEDFPGPGTTRLRVQVERMEEGEREEREDCSSSTGLLGCSPALWSVEQVCSYISSLPDCRDVVAEFRSQEIDGQALLLLSEEHLISTMNIKLGPALKICAQINSLKWP